jgi:hypothetical protein
MATIAGKRGTWNQAAATVKVDMRDAVEFLPGEDLPLSLRLATEPAASWKFESMDEGLDLGDLVVNGNSVVGTANVVVDDSTPARVRDVYRLKDGGVLLEVTAVPDATHVTFTRPGLASVDEALPDNAVLQLIGQMPVEGDDPQTARSLDPVGRFNYTEIFQELVEATRTERLTAKYGTTDVMEKERIKKLRELAIRWEKSMLLGKRHKSADSKQRFSGGLLEIVATNAVVDATKAAFEAKFKTLLEKVWIDCGASPKLFIVSYALKDLFNGLMADNRVVTRADKTVGAVASYYDSEFGPIELLMDRYMPKQFGVLVQEEKVIQKIMTDWTFEPLAKTGDSDRGQVISERGLMVLDEKAHGKFQVTDL